MSWTDERVETLKRMWGEGQSASQIAKELGGVTRNAVIGKVHRLGLSNRSEDEDGMGAGAPASGTDGQAATTPPFSAPTSAGGNADFSANPASSTAASARMTDPARAASGSAQSAQAQPTTVQPTSAQPLAGQSTPAQSTPAQPTAAQVAPSQPAPAQPISTVPSGALPNSSTAASILALSNAPIPLRKAIVPAGQPLPPQPSANEISPEALASVREVEKRAARLSLMELTERTCKWPIGDPATEDFWFCGLPSQPGKPYCEAHVGVAFQPMTARRDRRR